jgi:hypothetical protein
MCCLQCNSNQRKELSQLTPNYKFICLTIEVFGCLHKHANMFLHNCANAIWSLKWLEGLHFSTLVTFFHQKVLITLQRMQTSSIVSCAVVVGLTTSWLSPLQNTLPITIADLLQGVGFWHVNMADLPQMVNYKHGKIFTPSLNQLDILSLLPFS